MSALSPRQMWRLDEAYRPIRQTFNGPPYLVGTAQTGKTYRDVDVRLILEDERYDALADQLGPDGMAFLGIAFGEYLAARTGCRSTSRFSARARPTNATLVHGIRWVCGRCSTTPVTRLLP